MNLEAIKFDICCAARLLYRQGLSGANAGHLSVAVGEDRMHGNLHAVSRVIAACPPSHVKAEGTLTDAK